MGAQISKNLNILNCSKKRGPEKGEKQRFFVRVAQKNIFNFVAQTTINVHNYLVQYKADK